jgi:hypothetical protein
MREGVGIQMILKSRRRRRVHINDIDSVCITYMYSYTYPYNTMMGHNVLRQYFSHISRWARFFKWRYRISPLAIPWYMES